MLKMPSGGSTVRGRLDNVIPTLMLFLFTLPQPSSNVVTLIGLSQVVIRE